MTSSNTKPGSTMSCRHYHDPVICTYDLSRFDASVVIDIMRTHPMVIVGGILQENPFYVPPDEMLKELKERAADIPPG